MAPSRNDDYVHQTERSKSMLLQERDQGEREESRVEEIRGDILRCACARQPKKEDSIPNQIQRIPPQNLMTTRKIALVLFQDILFNRSRLSRFSIRHMYARLCTYVSTSTILMSKLRLLLCNLWCVPSFTVLTAQSYEKLCCTTRLSAYGI